jgi:fluoride exporter
MPNFVWIALGGGLGSLVRYSVSLALPLETGEFPKGTFLSNIIASVLVGIIAGLLISKFNDEHWLKYFLLIGFCGGFSTFSSYALEIYKLNLNGTYFLALSYAVASVLASVLAIFFGFWLSKLIN